MGSLQQALVCLEKRLVVAHELGGEGGEKAQAYCELGTLHSQLGNYEQALSCLEHQLNIARTAGVRLCYLAHQILSLCTISNAVLCSGLAARTNPWRLRPATHWEASTSWWQTTRQRCRWVQIFNVLWLTWLSTRVWLSKAARLFLLALAYSERLVFPISVIKWLSIVCLPF